VRSRRLTLDEVNQYKLETHRPPCLVCGKKLRYLSGHLITHGMTIVEYREFYGIPRFMKLSDIDTRLLKSEQSRELQACGAIGWHDRDAMARHASIMRAIPRKHNRPEIKSQVALDNCKLNNKGHSGQRERMRKLASTHTNSETKELQRKAAINRQSHIPIVKANAERGWVKSDAHEARRQEVLQERAAIIRDTPEHLLDTALIAFRDRCRIERNRRIVERRRLRAACLPNPLDQRAGHPAVMDVCCNPPNTAISGHAPTEDK
jgi:hypothetical protein